MPFISTDESRQQLTRALRLMSEALDILDSHDAPGEIGSILDLARARLEALVVQHTPPDTRTLLVQLEQEFTIVAADGRCKPSPWGSPSLDREQGGRDLESR